MTAEPFEAGAPMAYLDGLTGYEQTGRLESPTLERMVRLAGSMGDPQRRYPVIHLTGTNGKGSTAAMTARLLSGPGSRQAASRRSPPRACGCWRRPGSTWP
jgi:dihydrofolate synthase / folylpolyglutamate synthase